VNLLSRYSWVVGTLLLWLYIRLMETRAQFLMEADRLSPSEAKRFRQLVLYGGALIVFAVALAHVTYRGEHGICTLYADPLRPPALIAWTLILGVLVRFGTLGLTAGGAHFLARVWPALAVLKPLDQSWTPAQVVARSLLTMGALGLLFGLLIWSSLVRPGTLIKC
jgi:hypothetical protein